MEDNDTMKESEKRTERILNARVKAAGGVSIKLLSFHVKGLPDRAILLPGGICVFVEVKSPGKKPTKMQEYMHDKIRALGFRVEVIDREADINKIVR